MKTNPQKLFLLSAAAFFILFSYVFYFLYDRIEENNALAEESNIKWQEEASRLEEIKSLDRSLKMTTKEREELEKHFAKSSDLVPFLDTIEGLARKAGAAASTTSVDLSQDDLSLLVGLKALGSFQAIYKFLTLLENSPYELEFLYASIYRESAQAASPPSPWEARFVIKLLSFTD